MEPSVTPPTEPTDVVIVRKQSAYERHGSSSPKHKETHASLLRVFDALVRQIEGLGLSLTVVTLEDLMTGRYAFYKADPIATPSPQKPRVLTSRTQLVIAVGGDGTLLHASHFLGGDTKLLGINAVPRASVGHLCLAKDSNFATSVSKALDQRLVPKRLQRLQVSPLRPTAHISTPTASQTEDWGERLPLALNDVLFCNAHPAATSRYTISVTMKDTLNPGQSLTSCTEDHVSSGVWISTAAGSTAAISSYGLQRLPLESSRFLIAVREPYFRPESFCALTRASLNGPEQGLTLVSQMTSALVAVDGADFSQQIGRGDGVVLTMAPENQLLLYI